MTLYKQRHFLQRKFQSCSTPFINSLIDDETVEQSSRMWNGICSRKMQTHRIKRVCDKNAFFRIPGRFLGKVRENLIGGILIKWPYFFRIPLTR